MADYPGNSIHRPTRWCAVLFGGLFTLMAPATHAEIRLEGQVDAIQIEMHDASVQEALAALAANYGLRFSSAITLDHGITGSFKGPLHRVVGRLLDRYDYVVKSSNGSLEVVVLGRKAAPIPPSVGRLVPPPPRSSWTGRLSGLGDR